MRLIDADALDFERIENEYGSRNECVSAIEAMIDNAPAVDAEPVRHERWIQPDRRKGYRCCSGCKNGGIWVDVPLPKFCGECGAKMDKEEQK